MLTSWFVVKHVLTFFATSTTLFYYFSFPMATNRSYGTQICPGDTRFEHVGSEIGQRFKRCLVGVRLSRVAVSFLIIFLLFHYITNHFLNVLPNESQPSLLPADTSYRLRDLKHIKDLKRIKKSVSIELRDLEHKRNQMQDDISTHQGRLNSIEQMSKKAQNELDVLKRQIIQLKNEQREAAKPKIAAPARIVASETDNIILPTPTHYYRCHMHNCFDYSRCSLFSQFPVYVYPQKRNQDKSDIILFDVTSFIIGATESAFGKNAYVTHDPNSACIFVVRLGEVETAEGANAPAKIEASRVTNWLQSLSHWHGDGRNHILLSLTRRSTAQNPLLGVDTGRAMIAQSNFAPTQFRPGFDLVIPTLAVSGSVQKPQTSEQEVDQSDNDKWLDDSRSWVDEDIPVQVPAMRKYMLSFQGQWEPAGNTQIAIEDPEGDFKRMNIGGDQTFHQVFVDSLSKELNSNLHGKYLVQLKCTEDRLVTPGYSSEWALCGNFASRSLVLAQSTFTLISAPEQPSVVTTTSIFVIRLTEALRSGAVPVVLGTHAVLPFDEFVAWEKAAIIIPQARITELSFLLSNTPHAEILSMRRQARFIYDTYFSSPYAVVDSILAVVRSRLQIPPLPVLDEPSDVIEHESFKIENHEVSPGDAQSEFGIPPPEPRIDSPKFIRNFTTATIDSRDTWNSVPGPFNLYPYLPADRILPTDAQFMGSTNGFRPIGEGTGGTGKVYQSSLGGNSPREQFTIVMLTYERDDVLMQAIERLIGLPHLNKVVVVWNSPQPPNDALRWPKIDVEVVVVHPNRNSLNNRFVPWDEIQTECVLSIDDDAHLRHDEMLFGFRVWRQHRDRIVGFPGRFHAWDAAGGKWNYNSNHTCELSMVLTGAAFFHKYYMYLYTHWMPSAIREIVDEYMNCEDIAINFLVSHITRQPPVKVTSRWTFRCPGCPVALSQSQEHFDERHKCINKFVKIFGYMPLVFTQIRADSILFKTRLPHDKQKCFKFI
uniref:Exostosin-like 3 n=1 Tax=Phallusia mammillata TaxID=59560 RepID=A0A6F9DCZ2_9ASCI|nr:exostosin-like 3 [Phallusia mammillata]